MKELENAKRVERAKLLVRVVTESEHLTERDKDVTLFWIRDLLEPIKEYVIDKPKKVNQNKDLPFKSSINKTYFLIWIRIVFGIPLSR